ncbi:MAG: hypothetical protein NC211_09120 [Alistipes senegalensis]|nr:hypothetical protein [Oxalobacter formigenes]MCM1281969.1 hypothetical protein [Alistipes senegalensis]
MRGFASPFADDVARHCACHADSFSPGGIQGISASGREKRVFLECFCHVLQAFFPASGRGMDVRAALRPAPAGSRGAIVRDFLWLDEK